MNDRAELIGWRKSRSSGHSCYVYSRWNTLMPLLSKGGPSSQFPDEVHSHGTIYSHAPLAYISRGAISGYRDYRLYIYIYPNNKLRNNMHASAAASPTWSRFLHFTWKFNPILELKVCLIRPRTIGIELSAYPY